MRREARSLNMVIFKFQWASESPAGLIKIQILGLHPQNPDSLSLLQSLISYFLTNFPSDSDVAYLGTTL